MFFKRKKEHNSNQSVFVARITNTAFSGMYQELLRDNNIHFICRQQGAGGYLKIVTGGLFMPDDFYVNEEDYEKALGIYRAFIEPELEEN